MFSKILYPTDFSEVAGKALAYIKKLREAGCGEVMILHVIDEREIQGIVAWSSISGNWPVDLDSELKKREQHHLAELKKIARELEEGGCQVKAIVREGHPAQEILKLAEEEKADAIIIGSHGKSNLKEMLLGSVSESVIRKSPIPVLVIKR